MELFDVFVMLSSITVAVLFLIPIILIKIKKLGFNWITGTFMFYSWSKGLWLTFLILAIKAGSKSLSSGFYILVASFAQIFAVGLIMFTLSFKRRDKRLFFALIGLAVFLGIFPLFVDYAEDIEYDSDKDAYIAPFAPMSYVASFALLIPAYYICGGYFISLGKKAGDPIVKKRLTIFGMAILVIITFSFIGLTLSEILSEPLYVFLVEIGVTTPMSLAMLYAFLLEEKQATAENN